MLIAQNKKQELILADHSLDKKENYYCPSCQTSVHLKTGAIIRPHFAHFQNEACEVFAEGETIEHLEGKLQLAEWLNQLRLNVEVEAYLPELKQRPDLLVTVKDQKIALEWQCSPIPLQQVAERTKGYLHAGYEIIWILGQKFAYKNTLTAFQKACLSKEMKLLHYDTEKKHLTVRSQFHLNQQERMRCQTRTVTYGEEWVLAKSAGNKKVKRINNIQKRHNQLLTLRSEKMIQFQQLLYQNKENLISMPKALYSVLPSEWLIQDFSYEWKYRLVLWLESLPARTVVTKKSLLNWLKQEEITFYNIPQATNEQFLQPFFEFLEVLRQENYAKEIRPEKWRLQRPLRRYEFLEEKLKNH